MALEREALRYRGRYLWKEDNCNDVYTASIVTASSAADTAIVIDTVDEADDVRYGWYG